MFLPLFAEFEVKMNFTLVALVARKAAPSDTGTAVPLLSACASWLIGAQIVLESPNAVQSWLWPAQAGAEPLVKIVVNAISAMANLVLKLRLRLFDFISCVLIPFGGARTNAHVRIYSLTS